MKNQDYIRKEVKLLKLEGIISYKELAEDYLNITYNGFMNWLCGFKNLSTSKIRLLQEIIDILN